MPFCNLLMQDFYGGCSNLVNLLSDSTDGNDGFSGNRRIIETNNFIVVRKTAIFLDQMIEHDICKPESD